MLNSPEYTARNGQSNETFVRALFRDVLDRRPEAHEAEGWRGLLDAFAATRESLVEQFLHSKEYRTQMIRRWKETGLGRGPLPQKPPNSSLNGKRATPQKNSWRKSSPAPSTSSAGSAEP
jgi:hypothetical protein